MNDKKDRGTILAVDDTQANLDLLSLMLNSAGYVFQSAMNGPQALKSIGNDVPDLILLDIDMPEMNGFEVCRRLKADEQLKPIPVLFISALASTEDKVKAFQAGGVDYITKPFQVEEVLARVDTHLQIRRYQIELSVKSNILQKTLDDLKSAQNSLIQAEKMASLGVLAAGLAHEINNPINFIKTSVCALDQDIIDIRRLLSVFDDCDSVCTDNDLIERIACIKTDIRYDVLVRELPGLMNNISMGVARAEAVVNSLRTYSRPDHDAKKPSELSVLIDNALILLEGRYREKIDIQKKIKEIPLVPVQPGRFLQVLINVIGNAIDAVEEKEPETTAVISIETDTEIYESSKYAVVQVTDNGPGISDAVLNKIFDPFFTTKEVGKGIGLGMSISYGIVRDHNGRIRIRSGDKGGSTVSILLPFEGADL